MSSSPSTVHPQLPPTTNVLNSQQRTRLIRSTRKLGAVLGTTPYLLESDTSFTMLPLTKTTSRVLKRQGSIFTHHQVSSLSVASTFTSTTSSHHPSSSASSIMLPLPVAPGISNANLLPMNPPGLSTTRKRRSGDKVPQLYLRLDTVPVSPTDQRAASSLSPCTPLTPLTPTPLTPTVPDAVGIHRKRLAKLTHHLGENIPVELVFPTEPAPKSTTASSCRSLGKRTQSVDVMRTQAACIRDNRPYIGRSRQEWGEWNRPNIGDVQTELRKLKVG